jgi:uncharacterized membrane protein YoaK (UPF0700 family)
MTDGPSPPITGPLLAAIALAGAAGFVDAHVFVHVTQVFVANMSGNLVLLGIFVGDAHWPEVAAHLVAIALFTAGVAAGTAVHDRRRAAGLPLRPDLLLVVEAILLLGVLLLGVIDGPDRPSTVDAMDVPVLALGAFAMGLQTLVIGRVGSVAVTTTYETGAVARVGQESALAARAPESQRRARHLATVKVLGTIVLGYVGGAAAASAASSSPAWLLVPIAVVGGLAVLLRPRASEAAPG